jgi:Zn-dependent protease
LITFRILGKSLHVNIDWISAAWIYLVFVFSTTLHEAAHAWAAMKFGDDTARRGGQVSLNPVPHIRRSPFGMVVVPLLSLVTSAGGFMIGWASTPYNAQWAMTFPRRSALMALAGPASNLLLVLLASAGMLLCVKLGVMTVIPIPSGDISIWHIVDAPPGGVWPTVATLLSVLFSLNLLLGMLNLMPIPPFDGAALPLLAMSDESARRFMVWRQRSGGAMTLIALLIVYEFFWGVFAPVWRTAVGLLRF